MRILLALLAVGLLAVPSYSQTKDDPPEPKITLKAGDKAPAFKVDKWLQGGPVAALETGKVYVVEFWATWCGPCITMMPHLADLADEYKAKGVTVIGFSSAAQDKPDLAEKFVAKRGPKLGYAFAWCNDDKMHTAWMAASGQGGIPCSFVIDKEGKIAYIGHPMWLDGILPKVLDGTWDAAKGAAEVEAAEKDFERAYQAMQNKDTAAGLKEFETVLAARPAFADIPYLLGVQLELLLKNKRIDQARSLGEKVLAKAAKRGDTNALRTVRGSFLSNTAKTEKALVTMAVKASEMDREISGADDAGATIRLAAAYAAAGDAAQAKKVASEGVALAEKSIKGDKDWQGQLLLAQAHSAAGDKAAAKSAAEKAIAAAGNQRGLKEYVVGQAKEFGAEPPPEESKDKKDK